MSLDLVYERLVFQRTVAENSAETVVEGTVTLPDGAPEVGRALKMGAVPHVTDVEVKDGKVTFEGVLDMSLLYSHFEERHISPEESAERDLDEDEESTVGEPQETEVVVEENLQKVTWKRELPFAFLLDLPGVMENQQVHTDVQTRECTCELRTDQVTLDVDVALEFRARRSATEELTVPCGVTHDDDVDVRTRKIRVKNFLGSGEAETEASGDLSLAGRAVPENFLEVRARADVTEAFVDDGRVRVKGNITYTAFYVGAEGAGPQYSEWPRGAAFEAEIKVAGARRGADARVSVTPAETVCRVSDGAEGRILDARTPLLISVQVEQVNEVPLITGLESESKEVAVRPQTLQLLEAVGEGVATEEAETSLDLPKGMPGIDRILFGETEAVVDDVHVLGDKVAVELHVDVDLVYVGRSAQEGGVHTASWPRAVGLDLEIPLEGAEPGLEREVSVKVDSIQLDLVNRESVDARVYLTAQARISREVETEVVAEATEIPPLDENPPTYTYVVVQPGETVWKLAARYRSQAEVIVAANDWLESDQSSLPTGRKLCVPRKVAEPVA